MYAPCHAIWYQCADVKRATRKKQTKNLNMQTKATLSRLPVPTLLANEFPLYPISFFDASICKKPV